MKTDNPVFVWMGKLGDLIGLNLLFLACCLPILTIGASATALFYTARKLLEGECVSLTKTFFHSFRQNWKQAMGVFLILLIVGALTAADLILGFRTPGASGNLFRGIGFGLGLVWLMVCVYIFALLSRYEYRTGALIYSAFLTALMNPMVTIAGLCLILVMPALAWFNGNAFFYLLLPYLLVGPALSAMIVSVLLRPVFRRMEEKKEEETYV